MITGAPTKGGVLDVFEMEQVQGIKHGIFNLGEAKTSVTQYGGMIGNAVCWNVLAAVVPNALQSAGLCSDRQGVELVTRADTAFGVANGLQ